MAKSKKLENDDFDFDSSLDMPDFDFNAPAPKDDRSPVTKFARGAAGGFKDAVTEPAFIRETLRKSLPKGYGQVLDLADEGASTLRNLYNTGAKELKPAINDIKKATNKILPSVESVLPKSVAEKIKKWSSQENKNPSAGVDQMREQGMQADLADIFSTQTTLDQHNRAEDKAGDALRDQVQQKQHTASLTQMDAMRQSLQAGVNFDTKITAKYQRKSLEIQYRQYFLQMDLLEETKRNNAEAKQSLEGILKNTGLPEFAKLKTSERLHEALRNKFIDGLNDTVFEKRRQFLSNVGKRLATSVKDKAQGFASAVSSGAGMVDSLADLREMQKDFGGPQTSATELGGSVAGGLAADKFGNVVGKKLRGYADKNEKAVKLGNQLSDFATNKAQYAQEWAKSDKHENTGIGFVDALVRFGKDQVLGALGGHDTSLTEDKLGDGNNPDIFGRQTNKSITEIIPGYLARIWREIKILRTGDESIGLTEYDFMKNRFNDRKTIAKNVREGLVGKRETSGTHDQIDRLIDELEKDQTTKLTPEQRKILGRKLLKDNMSNKRGDADRYSTEDEWRGDSYQHKDQFQKIFKDYFKDDKLHDKRRVFGQEFSNLGNYISDSRRKIQDHVNTGSREHLEALGLVDPDSGNIDMDRLYNYYYDPTGQAAASGPAGPGGFMGGGVPPTGNPATVQAQIAAQQSAAAGHAQQRSGSARNRKRQRTVQQRAQGGYAGSGPAPIPTEQEPISVGDPGPAISPMPATSAAMSFDASAFDKVVQSIRETSILVQATSMDATLLRIEKQIAEGVQFRVSRDRGADGAGGHVGDLRVRDLPGHALAGAKAGWGWLKGKAEQGKERAKFWGGKALTAGGKFKDLVIDKANMINDVYVQGEAFPRLTKAGIEAGKYRDKLTGQIITKWGDIKGEIIDEDGNIILDKEALKTAFIKTNVGQKLIKGFVKVKDWTTGVAMWGAAKFRAAGKGIYGVAIELGQKAFDLSDQAQDVYVTGDPQPRLLGITMKVGGYASRLTSKPIFKPSQIDGPVYNDQGQMVLTEDDLKKGLLDSSGRPLVTGWKKILRVGLDTYHKVKNAAISLKNKVFEKAGQVRDWVKDKFNLGPLGEKLGKFFTTGPLGISAKKTVDLLTEIRNILNDRLPGKKRKVEGDVDGDGIREGSYEDLKRKKAGLVDTAKEKLGKLKGEGFAKSKDLGTFITDNMKGALNFFKKKKHHHDDDDDEGDDGLSLDDLPDGRSARDAKKARRLNKLRSGRGLWGKTKGLMGRGARGIGRLGSAALDYLPGKGMLRGAGRLAGGAGRALMGGGGMLGRGALMAGRGAMALGGLGMSGLASAASGAAGLAGSAIGGIGAAAGAAGGMIGTAAGAIATGLGAIFTAPVLLTALGVAALGIGAYYGYKYLTRKKLGLLSTVRYAQYGFLASDTDHLAKVFELEDTLEDAVQFSGGQASIDQKKVDIKKAIESFGVDTANEDQRSNWEAWFMNRFKPVYLMHMAVLAGMKGKKLSDVDDLKGDERKSYFNATKFPGGPYDMVTSPFPDLPKLLATSKEVQTAIDVASTEITKDDKTGGAAALAEDAKKNVGVGAAIATGAATAAGQTGGAMGEAAKALTRDASGAPLTGPGVATMTSAEVMSDVLFSGRVDALTALRLRTYGLVDLETEKVRTLQRLENMTLVDVTFKNDTASWNGSLENMLNQAGASFGVPPGDNPNAIDWMTWFSKRFLPTYLKYLTVLKKVSGKSDMKLAAQTLKPQEKLDVAQVVYTTNTNYSESMASVWSIPASPWPGYQLNMDVKSIDGNLQSLKDAAQSANLDEESGKTGRTGLQSKDGPVPEGATGDKPGFHARLLFGLDQDGNKAKGGWFSNAGSTIMDATKSGLESLGIGGGREVEHPGKGTGGDINALPKPTGKGYAAMRDMLAGVGKMTGVDEKLLASIIGIESGFDPSVKAGSSSATGLGQFIKDTWSTMIGKYGAKYGIAPDTPPTDARANALMTAEFLKENANAIKGSVNRKLTDTDLYLAHFLGAGGAKTFLSADPATDAVALMPKAAKANPSIFYDKNGKPRTVGEVYGVINGRVRASAKKYGVDDGSEKLQATGQATTTAPATSDASKAGSAAPSTGTAAPGPAGVTTNPVGNFKTSEQSPSGPVSSDMPVATKAPVTEPGADKPAPTPAQVAGMGFSSSRVASAQDQSQFQSSQFTKIFGTLDAGVARQIELQEGMLSALNKLVEHADGKEASDSKASSADTKPATPLPSIKPRAQQVQAPPVPMTKNSKW